MNTTSEAVKHTSELIKISSLPGHERNVADYVFTALVIAGAKPQKQSGNIVVHIKGTDGTKAVIFDAHMDTVSPGALSQWKYPPYGKNAGQIHEDKIYGLGASDAKSSIASLLVLAKEFVKDAPPIDVWFMFVTEEEIGGNGTKRALDWFTQKGYQDKYTELSCVICEPTDIEEVRIGHRGNMNILITRRGGSGQASESHLVRDQAILGMVDIIDELEVLEKDWQKKYADTVLGKPSIAVTSINAGELVSPNKFPDTCTITVDVRTTQKLHKEAFMLINQVAKKYSAESKIIYNPAPPGYTDKNAKIVSISKKLVGKLGVGRSSTDLCFFSELSIPGVIIGPGTEEAVHKPNEYCEIKKLEKSVNVYKKIVSLIA